MEATIIVSERKEKAGTGKNGKPYLLTTLVSREGAKYAGFNIIKEIQPGYSVKLLATPNEGYKNSYNIERIIEYDPSPIQAKPTPTEPIIKPKAEALEKPMTPLLSKPTEEQRLEWIQAAINLMKKAGMDAEIESSLLTELVRQQHSEWIMERINREKQQNMDRITKERART